MFITGILEVVSCVGNAGACRQCSGGGLLNDRQEVSVGSHLGTSKRPDASDIMLRLMMAVQRQGVAVLL
jgi:hypothetical protein